jgi:hypothetical protein
MARASLFLLAVVCMVGFAVALDHTHVNNALPVGIVASTVYSGSGFTNRNIPAGGSGKLLLSSRARPRLTFAPDSYTPGIGCAVI